MKFETIDDVLSIITLPDLVDAYKKNPTLFADRLVDSITLIGQVEDKNIRDACRDIISTYSNPSNPSEEPTVDDPIDSSWSWINDYTLLSARQVEIFLKGIEDAQASFQNSSSTDVNPNPDSTNIYENPEDRDVYRCGYISGYGSFTAYSTNSLQGILSDPVQAFQCSNKYDEETEKMYFNAYRFGYTYAISFMGCCFIVSREHRAVTEEDVASGLTPNDQIFNQALIGGGISANAIFAKVQYANTLENISISNYIMDSTVLPPSMPSGVTDLGHIYEGMYVWGWRHGYNIMILILTQDDTIDDDVVDIEVYIDGVSTFVFSDKTFADQGYEVIYNHQTYDSSCETASDYDVSGDYPIEGMDYWTTIEDDYLYDPSDEPEPAPSPEEPIE